MAFFSEQFCFRRNLHRSSQWVVRYGAWHVNYQTRGRSGDGSMKDAFGKLQNLGHPFHTNELGNFFKPLLSSRYRDIGPLLTS